MFKCDAMTDSFKSCQTRQRVLEDSLVPVQHYLPLLRVKLALNMTCAYSGTVLFSRLNVSGHKKGDEVHKGAVCIKHE